MSDELSLTMRLPARRYVEYLRRYLRPQTGRAALMAALILASSALALASPQVIRYFLDTAQSAGPARRLTGAAVLFIAFAVLQRLAGILANYLSKWVGLSATNQLSAELTLHCLRLDMPFHKRHTPGELIERIDGDCSTLGSFFSQFAVKTAGNVLLVAGILVLLFRENVWVGLGMVVYTLLTLAVLGSIQRLGEVRWEEERQAASEQSGYIEERISGAEELRAAGAEGYALRRLYKMMGALMRKTRAAFVVSTLAQNLTHLVHVLGYSAGLACGVVLYLRGDASLGAAYLILNYVSMLAEPLQQVREQAADLQIAGASLRRVDALLAQRPLMDSGTGGTALPSDALGVHFRDVSFRYEADENVLQDLQFELKPGRVLGVLGRTGSGKSTLTRLIFRLYQPSSGSITLGGIDSRCVSLADLRRRVGLVTQDVQLFQATVRENLTLFDPAVRDEQIDTVLRELGLSDWVAAMPLGLDTLLQAGGQGISAGEAQLLAFARVFLKDPGLVVLDEASSRLDPATEMRMERALDRLFKGRTGMVIAHRLKTIERADDILILEEGRVVETGPRKVLADDPHSRFSALLRAGLEEVLA